jgi:membrane-bound lytic murein transglycosylase F
MKRVRTHTKWIAAYTGVVTMLAAIAGIGMENGRSGEKEKFLAADHHAPFAALFVGEGEFRFEDFDYHQRLDLGYPRIGAILDSYEGTIRRYADRYGFDWRLILAVMNQESRFVPHAVSHRGAYGLMQIMPVTGVEVSAKLGIDGVSVPEDNIAGGVYYLWRMHTLFGRPDAASETEDGEESFDRLRLALAAYNGGPSRIGDAQMLARYLNLDPYQWEIIRDLLPMLSRRYTSLHRHVWESGRPSGGWFEGFNETIGYVDRTVEYYSYYRQIFPER